MELDFWLEAISRFLFCKVIKLLIEKSNETLGRSSLNAIEGKCKSNQIRIPIRKD